MTSDETRIQTVADWPMSHLKYVTKDNRKKSADPTKTGSTSVSGPLHHCV